MQIKNPRSIETLNSAASLGTPLPREQAIQRRVRDFSAYDPALAQQAFAGEPELLEAAGRSVSVVFQ